MITSGNWTATSNDSWISISPASGTGLGEITVIAQPNTTGAARTAIVTITSDAVLKAEQSVTITITQAPSNGTSVDANAANALVVYPNPTTESIAINSDESVEVSVYSGSQYLFSQTVAGKQSVSLAELPAGEYIVVVKTAKGVSSHTVVKQ